MKKLILTFLIILSIPASWYLLGRGYFNMHDDLQTMRVYEMGKCFSDGQIPCRWSPDMAYGYGQAMFNFYSAFPYYLGQLIRMTTNLSIIASVKTLFLIALISSGLGMYFLAKEFWGRLGGILSAVFYIYAPYHALDIFVRGALSESFALAILPFLWLFLYRLIKKPDYKRVLSVSISMALLLTTHNISSFIYAPFTIIWVIAWLVIFKKLETLKYILFSGILGVGLASFFLLPAVFEQSLIQTKFLTSDYSDYHAHFVTLKQLFLQRSWGFGPSIFGTQDDISFQVGWPHWWLAIILGVIAFRAWLKEKKIKYYLIFVLLILFLFVTFLTHPRSLPIWEKLPYISFVQFPWRFLGLSIFFLSFALGGIFYFKFFLRKLTALFFILLTIFLNLSYFKPYNFSRNITDSDKLTGIAFELQQKAALLDYLPKTAEVAPPAPASENPKVIKGEGTTENFTKQSNRFSFDANIYSNALVVVPVMYFPDWITLVDDKKVESSINGAHGVISVNLDPGKHIVRGRFTNTPIRNIANALSIVSMIILFSYTQIAERKSLPHPIKRSVGRVSKK